MSIADRTTRLNSDRTRAEWLGIGGIAGDQGAIVDIDRLAVSGAAVAHHIQRILAPFVDGTGSIECAGDETATVRGEATARVEESIGIESGVASEVGQLSTRFVRRDAEEHRISGRWHRRIDDKVLVGGVHIVGVNTRSRRSIASRIEPNSCSGNIRNHITAEDGIHFRFKCTAVEDDIGTIHIRSGARRGTTAKSKLVGSTENAFIDIDIAIQAVRHQGTCEVVTVITAQAEKGWARLREICGTDAPIKIGGSVLISPKDSFLVPRVSEGPVDGVGRVCGSCSAEDHAAFCHGICVGN